MVSCESCYLDLHGTFIKKDLLPSFIGDGLWSMVVFCCWRILLPKLKLFYIAAASLATSYLIEFSQMIKWEWLVGLRSTFIGHMILGQGFLWTDLIAYTIGIVIIFFISLLLERNLDR